MTLRTHLKRRSRLPIALGLAMAVAAIAPGRPGVGRGDRGARLYRRGLDRHLRVLGRVRNEDHARRRERRRHGLLRHGRRSAAPSGARDRGGRRRHRQRDRPQHAGAAHWNALPGAAGATDTTGIAPGADNSSTPYTFVALSPGTYLYEASPFVLTSLGGGSQYQTAMGMYGALVVRPSNPAQAYDANSAFNVEHLVVVGELDKDLTLANAATFDMRAYAPEYSLFNGMAAPDTTDLAAAAGDKVLLRMVNGGLQAHPMGLLGLDQVVMGEDGNALANPRHIAAETMVSGQTSDVIVEARRVPAAATRSTTRVSPSITVPLRERAACSDSSRSPRLRAPATPKARTSNVTFDLGTGALTASVSDATTGGSNIDAAEYFLDAPGAPGTGAAMSGAFPGDRSPCHTRSAARTRRSPPARTRSTCADGTRPATGVRSARSSWSTPTRSARSPRPSR